MRNKHILSFIFLLGFIGILFCFCQLKSEEKKIIAIDSPIKKIVRRDPFYRLYERAQEEMDNKEYENAVKSLEESLPFAKISIEKGMVYVRLAEIYKTLSTRKNNIHSALIKWDIQQ